MMVGYVQIENLVTLRRRPEPTPNGFVGNGKMQRIFLRKIIVFKNILYQSL
jgi:hypothetical protein